MSDEPDDKIDTSDATDDGIDRWMLVDRESGVILAAISLMLLGSLIGLAGMLLGSAGLHATPATAHVYPWVQLVTGSLTTLLYIALGAELLRARRYALEVDDSGVRCIYRSRVIWVVEWAAISSWQPVMDKRGRLLALRVTDHDGNEQRFSFGRHPPMGTTAEQLVRGMGRHAGTVQPLPPAVLPDPLWAIPLLIVVILGICYYTWKACAKFW